MWMTVSDKLFHKKPKMKIERTDIVSDKQWKMFCETLGHSRELGFPHPELNVDCRGHCGHLPQTSYTIRLQSCTLFARFFTGKGTIGYLGCNSTAHRCQKLELR